MLYHLKKENIYPVLLLEHAKSWKCMKSQEYLHLRTLNSSVVCLIRHFQKSPLTCRHAKGETLCCCPGERLNFSELIWKIKLDMIRIFSHLLRKIYDFSLFPVSISLSHFVPPQKMLNFPQNFVHWKFDDADFKLGCLFLEFWTISTCLVQILSKKVKMLYFSQKICTLTNLI